MSDVWKVVENVLLCLVASLWIVFPIWLLMPKHVGNFKKTPIRRRKEVRTGAELMDAITDYHTAPFGGIRSDIEWVLTPELKENVEHDEEYRLSLKWVLEHEHFYDGVDMSRLKK